MRILALLLVALALSCDSAIAPIPRPDGAVRMDPVPAIYAELYTEMEECSGLQGDFEAVRWHSVPPGGFNDEDRSGFVVGRWFPPNEIYILETEVDEDVVVKHEIGHHLIQDHRHPNPPFGGCSPASL